MSSKLQLIFDAMWKGKSTVAGIKTDVDKINDSATKTGKGLNSMLGKAEAQFVAVAAAAQVFVTALDFAEEGANIAQLELRFNALTDSIGGSADLLDRLVGVTGGAVTEMGAMESASQLMAMGLVQSDTELLKLFDTVNKLKSPTADLTSEMEAFSLMLANQSREVLDRFGISSGAVQVRMAELKAETAGMTTETAFFIAAMAEAENTMQRTGTAAGVTANNFTRLKNRASDNLAELKVMMSEGLDPIAKLLLGDYKRAIEETIAGAIEAVDAQGQQVDKSKLLADQLQKTQGVIAGITGATKANNAAVSDHVASQITLTSAIHDTEKGGIKYDVLLAELNAELKKNVGATAEARDGFVFLDGQLVDSINNIVEASEGYREQREEVRQLAIEQNALAQEQHYASQQQADSIILMIDAAAVQGDVAVASEVLERQTASLASAQGDLKENTSAAAKAFREEKETAMNLAGAFSSANSLVDRMIANEAELAKASGVTTDVIIDNSWSIARVSEQLASDLGDDQKNAYSDILDTVAEGSQEWLNAYDALQNDLSKSERQGLVARLSDLQNTNGQMSTAYTGNLKDYEAAVEEQKRLDQERIQSYQDVFQAGVLANSGVTSSTLDLFVATGIMTQEEADRTLQIATTTTALEELAGATEFAALSTEDQAEAYQLVIDGQAQTAEEAIYLAEQFYYQQGATAAASEEAINLKNNLLALDGLTVTSTFNLNTLGSFPTNPMTGSPVVPQDAIDSGDVTQRTGGGLGLGVRDFGGRGQGNQTSNAVVNNYILVPTAAMAKVMAGEIMKQATPTG